MNQTLHHVYSNRKNMKKS